jgi:hypothetical protein
MDEKQRKKKLLIRKIIKILFIVAIIGVAQFYFIKEKPANKELLALVAKYNAACPVMISNDIRMEGVHSLPDNVVQYDFTLMRVSKNGIDVKALKNEIEKEILSGIKDNPSLEAFRDNSSTVIYHYMDNNQENLFLVTLTPEMY